jgi:hypothetical protein
MGNGVGVGGVGVGDDTGITVEDRCGVAVGDGIAVGPGAVQARAKPNRAKLTARNSLCPRFPISNCLGHKPDTVSDEPADQILGPPLFYPYEVLDVLEGSAGPTLERSDGAAGTGVQ